MHEATIVENLVRILSMKAAEHGMTRIVRVRLKIGRLRGLDSRQIRGCFEIFTEGTVAENAALDISEVAVRARCRDCGTAYEVPQYRFACPVCAGSDADVLAGRELEIESFDGQREATALP